MRLLSGEWWESQEPKAQNPSDSEPGVGLHDGRNSEMLKMSRRRNSLRGEVTFPAPPALSSRRRIPRSDKSLVIPCFPHSESVAALFVIMELHRLVCLAVPPHQAEPAWGHNRSSAAEPQTGPAHPWERDARPAVHKLPQRIPAARSSPRPVQLPTPKSLPPKILKAQRAPRRLPIPPPAYAPIRQRSAHPRSRRQYRPACRRYSTDPADAGGPRAGFHPSRGVGLSLYFSTNAATPRSASQYAALYPS